MATSGISRRNAFRLGAAGVAVPAMMGALSVAGAPAAAGATVVARKSSTAPQPLVDLPAPPAPSNWSIKPFANNRVSLDAGSGNLFTNNRDLDLNFLANYPEDNIVYLFRANAGLPAPGRAIGSWDAADGNLRGHYSGHFLSALALAYAGGNGDIYKTKADYIVNALAESQAALAAAAAKPTPRIAGPFSSAVNLSGCGAANTGHSEHVALPAGVIDGLTSVTVATWVKITARTNTSAVFDFGTSTGVSHLYLQANTSGSRPLFGITNGSGPVQSVTGDAQLPTGVWTHLAVTLGSGTATLYVNGAVAGTNSAITHTPASLGSLTSNWIGRGQYPMKAVEFLNSAIAEFQVFDRVLSAAEVQALTTSPDGGTGGGNVVRYRFDEANGPTAVDSSGHGRFGHINAPTDGQRHPGFLAAYPETQFIRLEDLATYAPIWAPWYTNHMTMRGLLDAYLYTGNQQALEVVKGMADWAYSRLSKVSRTTLDSMWRIYIAGEYNAMPEVLADLAAVTGNPDYLRTAECFVNTYLFDAAAVNQDTINGEHANQHIPQYRSYLAMYDNYTDELTPGYRGPASNYLEAAKNFWAMVVPHRTYVDGGMAGSGEIFGARDVIASTISGSNAETCCVHNMLKLSRLLFLHGGDPKYMDYFERALLGQILASRRNTASTTNPNVTYFVPMTPGVARSYGNLGTCCGGTGLENHVKYQESVYFQSADESVLYVNLYIASTLNWTEKGVTVAQATDYPTNPAGETTLTITGDASFTLKLRVPYWAKKGFRVSVNGAKQAISAEPGTYVSIARDWTSGDTVKIVAPFSLRAERALDLPQTQGFAYGPVPMVTLNNDRTYLTYQSLYPELTFSGDLADALAPGASAMEFTSASGNTIRPFYTNDTTRYHAYMHREEPAIAFGGADSGVANYARPNGTTFLDELWDRAPFKTSTDFQSTVGELTNDWMEAGLLTAQERATVVAKIASPAEAAVSLSSATLNGKAVLTLRLRNSGSVKATFTVTTPFGAKTFKDVAPNGLATNNFVAPGPSFEAGQILVVSTRVVDGAEAKGFTTAEFSGLG